MARKRMTYQQASRDAEQFYLLFFAAALAAVVEQEALGRQAAIWRVAVEVFERLAGGDPADPYRFFAVLAREALEHCGGGDA